VKSATLRNNWISLRKILGFVCDIYRHRVPIVVVVCGKKLIKNQQVKVWLGNCSISQGK